MSLDAKELSRLSLPRSLLIRKLKRSERPTFLLTFDDGPHPNVTGAVLDRLEAFGIRAVFFVIGRRAQAEGALLRRILQSGHRLGNHSHAHCRPDRSFVEYYRDVQQCQSVLIDQTGISPDLFRPPGGKLSATGLAVARLLGMRTVTWSLNVHDWRSRSVDDALAAAAALERQAAPEQITVLHDDNPQVLNVLDYVLPRLRDRGFDLQNAIDLL